MKPILIAQITDLHIKPRGQLAYGKVDTAAALQRCVAELNRFSPQPDLIVISGDLADTPVSAEYDHLNALLAPLKIPLVAVPGNHDDRAMMRAALPKQPYARQSGPLDLVRQVGELDVIGLDSSVLGRPNGRLEPETLQWLDAELGNSFRPALIFIHHPPFVTGIGHMDLQNLHNADALDATLKKYARVKLLGCGHVHRATATMFGGVTTTICPAPNHAVALDLAAQFPPSFKVEPPAFHLHVWHPGGSGQVVTHTVPIGDFPGPHPFFGTDGKLL